MSGEFPYTEARAAADATRQLADALRSVATRESSTAAAISLWDGTSREKFNQSATNDVNRLNTLADTLDRQVVIIQGQIRRALEEGLR